MRNVEKRAQLTRKRQFEDQESRSVDAEGEGLEDKEVEGTEGMKGWNKKRDPGILWMSGSPKTAAAYSSNWWVSTIGASELNFSVRNGKRWFLTAITAALYHLRENPRLSSSADSALFLGLSFF